jgi:hypothetical protein
VSCAVFTPSVAGPLSGQKLQLSTGKDLETLLTAPYETAFPAYKHLAFVISENKPVLPPISVAL